MNQVSLKTRKFVPANESSIFTTEMNSKYEYPVKTIELNEVALILVDAWENHPNNGFDSRTIKHKKEKIAPLLELFRKNNMKVIYAPHGREVAANISPCNDDFIIPSGLDAKSCAMLLNNRGIKVLFYAGYAVNWCILSRPCGIINMHRLGFETVIVRDCTLGFEMPETLEKEWCKLVTINIIEHSFGSSTTIDDINSCFKNDTLISFNNHHEVCDGDKSEHSFLEGKKRISDNHISKTTRSGHKVPQKNNVTELIEADLLLGTKVKIDLDATKIGGAWQGKDPATGIPRPWDPETLKFFYDQTIRIKNPFILDIGANTGVYCLLPVLNRAIKGYAFEPNPEVYPILKNNLALNEVQDNIQTIPIALSDRKGTVKLKIPLSGTDSGLSCLGKPQRFECWREISVPMNTLDNVAKWKKISHVDLIKIDTEGCELPILLGGEQLIRSTFPRILLEFEEQNTAQFGYHPDEIVNLLTSWGYDFRKISTSDAYFYKKNNVLRRYAVNDRSVPPLNEPSTNSVFNSQNSELLNIAIIKHLDFLNLPISGKNVLEVGAGFEKLTHFFAEKGCRVFSTEALINNIEEHKKSPPHRHAEHGNLSIPKIHKKYGNFDIIFCHETSCNTHNPYIAIKEFSQICDEIFILETCVSPCDNGKVNFLKEDSADNQKTTQGRRCRPARDWIFKSLSKIYPHVYSTIVQPNHPEFPTAWPNEKSKTNSRSVFIASKIKLSSEYLIDYIPQKQIKLDELIKSHGKSFDTKANSFGPPDMSCFRTTPDINQKTPTSKPVGSIPSKLPYSHWISLISAVEDRLYYRDQSTISLESLTALARGHAPTVIIELGTLSGMSTRAWTLAVPKAQIHAVDLSFKAFWIANEHFPVDTSRITFHEQNILAMDFKPLWSVSDRVLFFVDAHDLANTPIMRHVLTNALPYLPKDSLVVVDDIWFSQERLAPDKVQEYFDKFLLGQIDELQCFTGHFAPYHKGGSFMGFREVLPLMEFVNSRCIDLGYHPEGKHVWFPWDGERHQNQKPLPYDRDERESGFIEYNPLAVRANEPLASRILPKVARLYQQGQIRESARILIDLINKEPSRSACFAMAICQARLGQLDAAYKLSQLARQTGKEDWRVSRLANALEQRIGRPKVQRTCRKGLTIFAVPKAFKGHESIIQKNAIRSWTRLDPTPEIILMGNDPGVREMALEIGARHIPDIATNEFGTPLVDDIFRKAWDAAANDILAYVNADIILMNDFQVAATRVSEQFPEFLIIGQRWDLPVWEEIDFHSPAWGETLRKDTLKNGFLHAETGLDYFIHSRGLWRGMPPFALGRTAWDNWLVKRPHEDKIPIIDGTGFISAVHQDHGYDHCLGGKEGAWKGVEATRNRAMAGIIDNNSFTSAAKWKLSSTGISVIKNQTKPKWQTDEFSKKYKDWLLCQIQRTSNINYASLSDFYKEQYHKN